jgi:hypothetical protein
MEGTLADPRVILKPSRVVPKRPRVPLLKVFNNTRVVLKPKFIWKCDCKIALHMESPRSLRLSRRLWLRVNLKFWQDYPAKSREKTEGHVARSPRALSRVLPLELKGHLECRMCPELLLNLVSTQKLSRCSRAPEIRRIDYWKLKGQAAATESAILKHIHPATAEPPVDL